jgi:hypothetical protein
MNSGIRPNFTRSSGSTSRRTVADTAFVLGANIGAETDRGLLAACRDDLVEAGKCATADEQDVGRVDLQEFLLRMLAAALRRNGGNRAFHDLQKRLLDALARHVAGDRRVVRLARDLVDLVDVDDAALGAFDIVVGRLQQLEDDVLDILADITGFGQRRGIGHGEGHIDDARQRLRQQRLAATGRADQQDVGLGKFDVVVLGRVVEALVMVVNRHREDALGLVLADHILVKDVAMISCGVGTPSRDLTIEDLFSSRMISMHNSTHSSQMNTVGTGNEFAHFVLALAAERAVKGVFRIAAAPRRRCLQAILGYNPTKLVTSPEAGGNESPSIWQCYAREIEHRLNVHTSAL